MTKRIKQFRLYNLSASWPEMVYTCQEALRQICWQDSPDLHYLQDPAKKEGKKTAIKYQSCKYKMTKSVTVAELTLKCE